MQYYLTALHSHICSPRSRVLHVNRLFPIYSLLRLYLYTPHLPVTRTHIITPTRTGTHAPHARTYVYRKHASHAHVPTPTPTLLIAFASRARLSHIHKPASLQLPLLLLLAHFIRFSNAILPYSPPKAPAGGFPLDP
jgi:hypothetical protein